MRGLRESLRFDLAYGLIPLLMLAAYVAVGSLDVWSSLTVNGLATGMMIFMASIGFTLVFGLMGVLNFGHAAFIGVGSYAVYYILSQKGMSGSLPLLSAFLVAFLASAASGFLFERLIVRPTYGDHLRQILGTTGGLIILEQLLIIVFGNGEMLVAKPAFLSGSIAVFGWQFDVFKALVIGLGLAILILIWLVFFQTKIGILIRAAVENRAMAFGLGYRVDRLFLAVFVLSAGLAGLSGAVWVLYRGTVSASIGSEMTTLIFIAATAGSLGSISGCFLVSLLVALFFNYVSFLVPGLSSVAAILSMALILVWRPYGLFGTAGRES